MVRLLVAFLCLGTMLSSFAEPARKLTWDDLTVKVEFEDPFEKLTQRQLMDLSIYARIKSMLEAKRDVTEDMKQEMRDAEKKLIDQAIDVQGLLAQREEITELRKKRAFAMDSDLSGKTIRMPGYALALEFDGQNVKEFLLVPWVGACIHTPPPPPNQIVYVEASEAFKATNRFEPVWIEGVMQVGQRSEELYLVDGSANISIGYSMSSARIEKFTTAPAVEVRPGPHDPNKKGS